MKKGGRYVGRQASELRSLVGETPKLAIFQNGGQIEPKVGNARGLVDLIGAMIRLCTRQEKKMCRVRGFFPFMCLMERGYKYKGSDSSTFSFFFSSFQPSPLHPSYPHHSSLLCITLLHSCPTYILRLSLISITFYNHVRYLWCLQLARRRCLISPARSLPLQEVRYLDRSAFLVFSRLLSQ